MSNPYELITLQDPTSSVSEAYRTLRMNLIFAAVDKPLRTLLITSPGPDEGKSTTLANLGVTFAQIDRRVILADCDLRHPCLHHFFGLNNQHGLTDMMMDEQAMEEPRLQETSVPNLWLLASGALPARPSDLLGSRKMESAISRLCDRADIVLFDAPPIMVASDALVLATKVDGVLLTFCAGKTKRQQAQEAIDRLRRVNAFIVGSVLTNAPQESILPGY